jgi:hypothetical protein
MRLSVIGQLIESERKYRLAPTPAIKIETG